MRHDHGFTRVTMLLSIVAILICAGAYLAAASWLQRSLAIDEVQTVELASGSSSAALAVELEARGLLSHTNLFRIWTRLHGIDTRLKAGEYVIEPGDSITDLLDKMQRGDTRHYSFTLIEGWNFRQLRAALSQHPQIVHTLEAYDNGEIMRLLNSPYTHPEGLFLPDTYHIDKNTRDIDLLRRAHQALFKVLNDAWQQRQQDLPLEDSYEALILASIVEKESAVAEERPLIAGVFVNRLRKNMRLQTDPTVIYGMGESYDGDIRFRDLRRDTPYNTYTRRGLPPTPIAMPGAEAIYASLQPADTEYLYFVAMSDRSGRHVFSRTNAEHEKQVDIHQRGK